MTIYAKNLYILLLDEFISSIEEDYTTSTNVRITLLIIAIILIFAITLLIYMLNLRTIQKH